MMKPIRTATRRSFLRRVGAYAAAGTAMALVGGSEATGQNVRYSGVTDCDTGNGADRPGYGTGNRNQVTDRDTGPNADPRCHGRGSTAAPSGSGQYGVADQPATGCSDSDYGQYGDPGGRGRRCRGNDLNPSYPQPPRISN